MKAAFEFVAISTAYSLAIAGMILVALLALTIILEKIGNFITRFQNVADMREAYRDWHDRHPEKYKKLKRRNNMRHDSLLDE